MRKQEAGTKLGFSTSRLNKTRERNFEMKAFQPLRNMLNDRIPFFTAKRESSGLDQEHLLESSHSSEQDLSTSDHESEPQPRSEKCHPTPLKYHRTYLSIIFKGLFALLALWGLIDFLHRTYATLHTTTEVSCNCGETISEAISRGCKYDSLAAAWLPAACRDDPLLAEFERLGPNPDGSWNYYADRDKNVSMSLEEVSMLPNTGGHFFATHEWHIVHCSFYWKKMFRAKMTGVTIEKRYDRPMHLDHCLKMFLARDPLETMAAEAGVALHSDTLVVGHRKDGKGHGEHEGHKEGGKIKDSY